MRSKFRNIFVFVIISLAISLIWFSNGKLMAAGEESFSIFNNTNILSLNGVWEEIGTGIPNPTYLLRILPSVIVRAFFLLGVRLWEAQSFMFFVIILTGMISMFYLAKLLLYKKPIYVYFFASIFYFFNLYSLFQIFGRFLYSSIFAWALAPLSLYFWIKWIDDREVKYIIFFVLSSIVFSLSYLQPANIITLWVPLLIWVVVKIFTDRRQPNKVRLIFAYTFMGIFSWVIFNIWWIYPYIKLSAVTFSTISNLKSNIDSLEGVSKYFQSDQIALLRQAYYLGKGSVWYEYYSNFLVITLSIIVFGVLLLGVWYNRTKKYFAYLFILLILGWFVSKGTNPPFGKLFFTFMFKNFNFTAALRNSYEKFGLVFLLPYAIFFGLGAEIILEKTERFISKKLLFGLIILVLLFLSKPFISAEIIRNKQVEIPEAYFIANSEIKSLGEGRIFQIPSTRGDSIVYSWGYNGIEPSEFIFDNPSISKILRANYYDEKYLKLVDDIDKRNNVLEDFSEMGIRYVVVHKDIDKSVKWGEYNKLKETVLSYKPKLVSDYGGLEIFDFGDTKLFETDNKNVKLIYQKVNNTSYKVYVENSTYPFKLIFKSTYNPYWVAKINSTLLSDHQMIYDYANSWKVSEKGNFVIDVNFNIW